MKSCARSCWSLAAARSVSLSSFVDDQPGTLEAAQADGPVVRRGDRVGGDPLGEDPVEQHRVALIEVGQVAGTFSLRPRTGVGANDRHNRDAGRGAVDPKPGQADAFVENAHRCDCS